MHTFQDRTYDGKMHNFKEFDYKSVWVNLTITTKALSIENQILKNDSQSYEPSEDSKLEENLKEEQKEKAKILKKKERKSKIKVSKNPI